MNTTEQGKYRRGQTICRASGWIDVVQFFLLNYGLHAGTMLTEPGSTPLACVLASFTAILMPSVGIARAVEEMSRFAIKGGTDLDVALRAGALYTNHSPPEGGQNLISSHTTSDRSQAPPSNTDNQTSTPVPPYLAQVHGEYPRDLKQPRVGIDDLEDSAPNDPSHCEYSLIAVPPSFKVSRFLGQPNEKSRYRVIMDSFKGRKGRKNSASQRDYSLTSDSTSLEKSGATNTITPQRGKQAPKPARPPYTKLACNYNLVKTIAAIVQIVYDCFELYQVGKEQLDQYGYVSYQLTVIPYVLMSLANFFAGITGPRYPSRYLVHYRGVEAPGPENVQQILKPKYPRGLWNDTERKKVEEMTSGAVGLVYGVFLDDAKERQLIKELNLYRKSGVIQKIWRHDNSLLRSTALFKTQGGNHLWTCVLWLLSLAFMVAPYVILYVLTKFDTGHSTTSQRTWIMC
ncbi:hypothetical protein DFP73DRAFT_596048 [Morchella snyderi]|nr:hypothetical protein DFP73DRAFT_596048 [Morchella snyderi]